jgi:hypothetical protein
MSEFIRKNSPPTAQSFSAPFGFFILHCDSFVSPAFVIMTSLPVFCVSSHGTETFVTQDEKNDLSDF